jgi:hypothetical protein
MLERQSLQSDAIDALAPPKPAGLASCEAGRSFTTQLPAGSVVWMPYLFEATGERILENPTVLEIGSVHATDYGVGTRFHLTSPSIQMPGGYGLVEWSHRYTNETVLSGDRVFAGLLLQY